jgi:hypothetical protein
VTFDVFVSRSVLVVALATYFGAAFYAAFQLGGWGGAVLLAGLMVPPLAYVLVNRNRDGGGGLLVEQTRPASQQQGAGGIRTFNG